MVVLGSRLGPDEQRLAAQFEGRNEATIQPRLDGGLNHVDMVDHPSLEMEKGQGPHNLSPLVPDLAEGGSSALGRGTSPI